MTHPYAHLLEAAETLDTDDLHGLIADLEHALGARQGGVPEPVTYECIVPGHMEEPVNESDGIEQANRLLDNACGNEIVGDNVWKGSDGDFYSLGVEVGLNSICEEKANDLIKEAAET